MTYPETIKYLESFINYEKISYWSYSKSFKLERFRDFLNTIDNPQDKLRCLHIAGSKGKGSTCAFIAYALRQAGYKVGLYTSPHLSDFRERIRILCPQTAKRKIPALRQAGVNEFEGMIPKGSLIDLAERLKPYIEKYNKHSQYDFLSFFEIYTALAFVYFKEKKTDFVVLETGLGGRLDATNVVNPLACAITPISLEHTRLLGNTLRKIAGEKAGIIKDRSASLKDLGATSLTRQQLPVITAPQEGEVVKVIRQRCKKTGAKLYEVGKDILYQQKKSGVMIKGIFEDYPGLKLRLLGKHQFINASVAIGLIEALRPYGIEVDVDTIRQGFYNTLWPGRCEVFSRKPFVILDGAQNVASIRVLKKAVREGFKYKRLILVLGVSCDKDIKGICNELYNFADEVILTQSNNPRATLSERLAGYFTGKKTIITKSIGEARQSALDSAKEEDLILVCGSLFVAGEFRNEKL